MSSLDEIKPEAPDTAPATPGSWNLVQLMQPGQDVNPQVTRVSDAATSAPAPQSDLIKTDPTLDDLHKAIETQPRVGVFPMNSQQDKDEVKAQVDKLTPEDFKRVGELTRAIHDHDFKKFDEILNKYSCSQDHIRDIINGTNLWMQQTGLGEQYVLERGESTHSTTETETHINPTNGHEIQTIINGCAVAVDVLPWHGLAKPMHHFEADEPCG